MDLHKKIDALESEGATLKQQLAAPGLDAAERIAMRNNISAIGNQLAALYKLLAHEGTAGGLPARAADVEIPVDLLPYSAASPAPPCSTKALVDTRSARYPVLLSAETWKHVETHFADCIRSCSEKVFLTDGSIATMNELALLNVRVTLGDGTIREMIMSAYHAGGDLNVMGLAGLMSLGVYLDEHERCLKRAIMRGGSLMMRRVVPAAVKNRDAASGASALGKGDAQIGTK